jgi:glucose-6-phosphate dehydrogenase assembly protein OpcA
LAPDLRSKPVAHSVPEIERALSGIWAQAAASRAKVSAATAAREVVAGEEGAGAPGGTSVDAALRRGERHVAARSSVLNLVVVAGHQETAERCAATIAGTAGRHPSRSLIISALDVDGPAGLEARVEALAVTTPSGAVASGAETIHVTARGETSRHLASIIGPLLVHDLPVALWWPHNPDFLSHRAERLLPMADRLIVDSATWSGDGLDRLAAMNAVAHSQHLAVADFSLIRQDRWREALASVYDLPDLRPHLRAVRSITVEYAAGQEADPSGLTNVARPVYHVSWLASRLGMTVVSPLKRLSDGRRVATLRQGTHEVAVELTPACSDLSDGSTVRVAIASEFRGSELVGDVQAGDRTVEVTVRDKGRERVRRTYLAPRLNDVELLELAVEDNLAGSVGVEALAMAGQMISADPPRVALPKRRSEDYD